MPRQIPCRDLTGLSYLQFHFVTFPLREFLRFCAALCLFCMKLRQHRGFPHIVRSALRNAASPNKLESEYCALASEKAQFYEQYKEAKSELLKLKDAKQNVALFFREEKQTQHHEREGVCV